MKVLRILAAGAALLTIASCGKEYNSVPNGNNGDNPLLPLGTAGEGQIRYNLWQEKVRISGAYWNDTALGGSSTIRQIVGNLDMGNNTYQSVVIQLPYTDTAKKELTSKDSLIFSLAFTDFTNPDEPTSRVYTNQAAGSKGGAMTVSFSQQDATTLRGTFSGTVVRQSLTTVDTNDVFQFSNGTFWVKKR